MVSAIKDHSVWSSGAKTSAPGLGLRPDLVNVVDPDAVIHARVNKIMAYNPEALENPPTMPAESVCSLLYGGLCDRDLYREQVVVFCVNLAGELRRHGVTHKELPIHVDVRVPGDGDHRLVVLLGFKFGRGDFFAVFRVSEKTDAEGEHYFLLQHKDIEGVGQVAIVASLHRLLHLLFAESQASGKLRVAISKLRNYAEVDELAYRPELLKEFDVDMDVVHPVRRQKRPMRGCLSG